MQVSKQKKNRTAEIVIVASIVAALAIFFILGFAGGFAGDNVARWLNYYGHTFAGSLASFLYVTILFLCLCVIALVSWSLGKNLFAELVRAIRKIPREVTPARKRETPIDTFVSVIKHSGDMLLIIPAILFITIAALAMGEANEFARARLQDALVIGWEHAIFGQYVFAALGAIHYPHWLITFIIFSFENMSLILVGAGMILAYIAVDRFRELLVAFCIGILAMIPIWLLIPVLSPQDRYINNVYQLPESPSLAAAVADYHPQSEIANFLEAVRTTKANLPALPTSTMPSAHVFWASLAGYYLFRARKWLGWIVLPFLLASTFGTVLLAQHYFIDIPAGMAIAALAIWAARQSATSHQ